MAMNFCTTCGSPLESGSRFCSGCGGIVVEKQVVEEQATEEIVMMKEPDIISAPDIISDPIPMSEELPALKPTLSERAIQVGSIVAQASALFGNSAYALGGSGEMTFTQSFKTPSKAIVETLGPIKYLFSSFMRLLRGFKGALKDKKKWIPLVILLLVWIVMPIIKYFGIFNAPIYYLSVFTFAEGGLYNGLSGALGGVVGKGLVAGFLTQFISSVLSLKNPFAGIGRSLGAFFKSFSVQHAKHYSSLLMGCGFALIAYNFMGSYTMPQSMMVGVAGMVLSMKAIGNKTGFLKGLFTSLMRKSKKTKAIDMSGINRLIAGFSLGFAVSIPLSFSGIFYISYMIGALLLIIGIGLLFVPIGNKGGELR